MRFSEQQPATGNQDGGSGSSLFQYGRLWLAVVLIASLVAITPLIVLTGINYHEFERSLESEGKHALESQLSIRKGYLEFFLEIRQSALRYSVRHESLAELSNRRTLGAMYRDLKSSFGGVVDLGVLDSAGRLLAHVGNTSVSRDGYADEEWFRSAIRDGRHVSEVFLGFQDLPHFLIAVASQNEEGDLFVLQATISADLLGEIVGGEGGEGLTDAFLTNRSGALQTPSILLGRAALEPGIDHIPPMSGRRVWQDADERGERRYWAAAHVRGSPFVLTVVSRSGAGTRDYLELRWVLLGFVLASATAIVVIIMAIARYLVRRIREADQKRSRALRNVAYTNKIASLGRLAAGVAHEINNPLAIINEKAGLIEDLAGASEDFPSRERILAQVTSILSSVKRCRTITHRLLGFAKRMDVRIEKLDVGKLLKEVSSFLDSEAKYRNVAVNFHFPEPVPTIESDRGQLQQVFLNLLNNSMDSLEDGGVIEVTVEERGPNDVAVIVGDSGCGIPAEDLKHIFEPFFSTKQDKGTGLGLSITHGIVSKLGGDIQVQSEVGIGTVFTVILPKQPKERGSHE